MPINDFLQSDRAFDPGSELDRTHSAHPSTEDQTSQGLSAKETSSHSPGRVFYVVVGVLLTCTAAAKLWMLLTDSFADVRVSLPLEILWISVVFEFCLAFVNFRVRRLRMLAAADLFVFGAFAVFGFIRWWLGYSTCGCSGNIEIPLWVFLLIDVGIIGTLIATRTRRAQISAGVRELIAWWNELSSANRGRLVGLGLFLAILLGLQLPAAASLRGSLLGVPSVTASVSFDEELVFGEKTTGVVEIWNRSKRPVKIVGSTLSCKCLELVPTSSSNVVEVDGSILLPFRISPTRPGALHQRVSFFLDHPKQFRVNAEVLGFVNGEKK